MRHWWPSTPHERRHTVTPEELAEIRARAEAATPGPWTVDEGPALADPLLEGEGDWYRQIEGWTNTGWEWLCLSPEDAAFIAHAREDIPALVAEVERLQAELARVRPVAEAAQRWHVAAQHYDAAMRSRDYGAADLADAELNAATERLIAAVAGLDAAREDAV